MNKMQNIEYSFSTNENSNISLFRVKFWSDEIGKELKKLSEKMTRKSIVKEVSIFLF